MKIHLTLAASSFALAILGASPANAASLFSGGFLNFHIPQQDKPAESAAPSNTSGKIAPSSHAQSHIVLADPTELFAGKTEFGDAGPNHQPAVHLDAAVAPAAIVPSTVPEPATWAMLVIGFGAVGFAMRRKKELAPAG